MKRNLIAIALCAWCVCAQDTIIQIDASKPAAFKIPRTIFGTFLEPIGNSIYGGLWAQILENPSFEDNLWSATVLRTKLDANPALYRASQLGLPIPWEPLDQRQGARYEPRWNDAANSYRSLMLMALSDHETGIRQQVYLPVHRTLIYRGNVAIKHLLGPAPIEISLRARNAPAEVLAHTTITATSTEWKSYGFELQLKPGQVARLQPADFVIAASNGTRVLLDQVFLWPVDHIDGMDPDMIALSKALHTPIVRYGGNFTSAYHWRDGIGPMDRRVSMLNLAWGMPEYNHFGTDEFLRFCKLIGADPQIALNLGTGTPQEAAEWVEYVNRKWNNGRGGLTWELGNELWGDFQTGYPGLNHIAELTSDFSKAIRKIDATSKLIATGADPDHFDQWNAEQLKIAPGAFDALSTHFVVRTQDVRQKQPTPDFVALSAFALPVELERRLQNIRQQIEASPARGRVSVAFTEWLFWGPDDRSPRFTNMAGALCTAGLLNTLIRTADFVPLSDMTGLVEFGGIWKKRGQVFGVPAYWAFHMYSNADATRPVAVKVPSETYDIVEGSSRLPNIAKVPYLDLVAALNDGGDKLTVFAVNRHLEKDITTQLHFQGFVPAGTARVKVLRGASIYQANDETNPEAVVPFVTAIETKGQAQPYTFPKSSITVIEFRK